MAKVDRVAIMAKVKRRNEPNRLRAQKAATRQEKARAILLTKRQRKKLQKTCDDFIRSKLKLKEQELERQLDRLGVPEELPEEVSRYFEHPPGTFMVRVCDLKATRHRSLGVLRAWQYMWMAYLDTIPKREPLSVSFTGDGYEIEDGNSTYWVALASGWEELACITKEEEQ